MYKNSLSGGPAGYWGDWAGQVFSSSDEEQWGGSYSTESHEVLKRLNEDVQAGDVIVAYQTDVKAVIGFCVITKVTGKKFTRKIYLRPIDRLARPFKIHQHKHGTVLATSNAVNGMVMLRELPLDEMETLVTLSGAPRRVLQGKPRTGGYRP